MNRKAKALIFGADTDCRHAAELLNISAAIPSCEYICTDDFEELEKALIDFSPTLLIVLADGAKGMEGVYRARERLPELPVFWFSDDQNFGVQSYRLNCAHFSVKPVTADKFDSAFRRCSSNGIRYSAV